MKLKLFQNISAIWDFIQNLSWGHDNSFPFEVWHTGKSVRVRVNYLIVSHSLPCLTFTLPPLPLPKHLTSHPVVSLGDGGMWQLSIFSQVSTLSVQFLPRCSVPTKRVVVLIENKKSSVISSVHMFICSCDAFVLHFLTTTVHSVLLCGVGPCLGLCAENYNDWKAEKSREEVWGGTRIRSLSNLSSPFD